MHDNVFGIIFAAISICFALGGLIAGETMERKRYLRFNDDYNFRDYRVYVYMVSL